MSPSSVTLMARRDLAPAPRTCTQASIVIAESRTGLVQQRAGAPCGGRVSEPTFRVVRRLKYHDVVVRAAVCTKCWHLYETEFCEAKPAASSEARA